MGQRVHEQLGAWRAMVLAVGSVREVLEREIEGKGGVHLTWYEVMVNLSDAAGHRLRMQDLAERSLLSKSGLSQAVAHMEEAGFVRRENCESDRRGTFAVLTEAGERKFAEVEAVHLRAIQESFTSHLDEDEVRVLRTALERIATACPKPA
jgi:DNA-binding MarR family transcriptional regulator